MKAAPKRRRSSVLPQAKKARQSVSHDPVALARKLVAHLKTRTVRDVSVCTPWPRKGSPWPRKDAVKLIQDATALMAQEEPLIRLNLTGKTRLAIVGDLHGQFDDLTKILELHGEPSEECQYHLRRK